MDKSFIVGIDEAGRGPLAGPVAVGVVAAPPDFDWGALAGVADSKLLSSHKRDTLYEAARSLKKQGKLDFSVSMTSSHLIDRVGIVKAVERAMQRSLARLALPYDQCVVKLDGSLKAPRAYTQQETIIGGDRLEQIIGLASILAKVTRDRYMVRIAAREEFEVYDFAQHKGYGTRAHRHLIQQHGLSPIHRKSFCRRLH